MKQLLCILIILSAAKIFLYAQEGGINEYSIKGYAVNETIENYLHQGVIELDFGDEVLNVPIDESGRFDVTLQTYHELEDTLEIHFTDHPDYTYNTFSILQQGKPASTGKIVGAIHIPFNICEYDAITTLSALTDSTGIYLVAFSDSAAQVNTIYQAINSQYQTFGVYPYRYDSLTFVLDTITEITETPISQELIDHEIKVFNHIFTYFNTPLGIKLVHGNYELVGEIPETVEEAQGKVFIQVRSGQPSGGVWGDGTAWNYGMGWIDHYGGTYHEEFHASTALKDDIAHTMPYTDFVGNNYLNEPLKTWYGRTIIPTVYTFPKGFFAKNYASGGYHYLNFVALNAKGTGTAHIYNDLLNIKIEAEDLQKFDLFHESEYTKFYRNLLIPITYNSSEVFKLYKRSEKDFTCTVLQNNQLPVRSSYKDTLQFRIDDIQASRFNILLFDSTTINNDSIWNLVNKDNHKQWAFLNENKLRHKTYTLVSVDKFGVPISGQLMNKFSTAINIFKDNFQTYIGVDRDRNEQYFEIMQIEVDTLETYPSEFEPGRIYFLSNNSEPSQFLITHETPYSYQGGSLIVNEDEPLNNIISGLGILEGIYTATQEYALMAFNTEDGLYNSLTENGFTAHRIANTFKAGSFSSEEIINPTIVMKLPNGLTPNSVELAATITSPGNQTITEYGFCFALNDHPTLSNSNQINAASNGQEFTSILHTLTPQTHYFISAYVKTPFDVIYSEPVKHYTYSLPVFTDIRDGHTYEYTEIGDQVWMAENLSFIPDVAPPSKDNGLWVYKYFYSDTAEAKLHENYFRYGCLYSYEMALEVCPSGWHLPSDDEWKELESFLGMSDEDLNIYGFRTSGDVGLKLKSIEGWSPDIYGSGSSGGGVNGYGFNSLPGNFREKKYDAFGGGGVSCHWTSSLAGDNALFRNMGTGPGIFRSSSPKEDGRSVRCIKNKINMQPPTLLNTLIVDNNLEFTFEEFPEGVLLNAYRDVNSSFSPDKAGGSNRIATNVTDQDPGTPGVQWTDVGALGDASTNYFYIFTTMGGAESENSITIGEFDFNLITTPTTDFNEIALPLNIQGITSAADLMSAIPGCNSVARWNASNQGYEQYISFIPATNFDVTVGNPYYVNVTGNAVFTLVGEVVNPSFDLITTPTTDFNEVMLTLDKTDITTASGLMADIPSCNSIARWSSSNQGYDQYISFIPATNFDVSVGYPYYVNVTSNVTWPSTSGGSLKSVNSESMVLIQERKAPHLVYGTVDISKSEFAMEDLDFSAYFPSSPEEKLNKYSAGCMLKDGYYVIQCNTYSSGWGIEEPLIIEFKDKSGLTLHTTEVQLTYNPADKGMDLILESEKLFSLSQNVPNPFFDETVIEYQIPDEGLVILEVYSLTGQKIRTLVEEYKQSGSHEVKWNRIDEYNQRVPEGMYIYLLKSRENVEYKKATVVR